MTLPTPDTVIGRNPEIVETRVGDQTMMMNITQGKYFALEATGQRIWELIETPRKIEEIVAELVSEYDVEPDTCAKEVAAFAGQLLSDGLAVPQGDG